MVQTTIDIADNLIPEGYEAVAFRTYSEGEFIINRSGKAITAEDDSDQPRLVLRRAEPAELDITVKTDWLKAWAQYEGDYTDHIQLRERAQSVLSRSGIRWE